MVFLARRHTALEIVIVPILLGPVLRRLLPRPIEVIDAHLQDSGLAAAVSVRDGYVGTRRRGEGEQSSSEGDGQGTHRVPKAPPPEAYRQKCALDESISQDVSASPRHNAFTPTAKG